MRVGFLYLKFLYKDLYQLFFLGLTHSWSEEPAAFGTIELWGLALLKIKIQKTIYFY